MLRHAPPKGGCCNARTDTALKFGNALGCRLEQVCLFRRDNLPCILEAEHSFDYGSLWDELLSRSLLVPFQDIRGRGLITILKNVLDHHVGVLTQTHHSSSGRGGIDDAWRAYQSELALEEILYSHPLSPQDHHMTKILGTSASASKSITKVRGFPGLVRHNSVHETRPAGTTVALVPPYTLLADSSPKCLMGPKVHVTILRKGQVNSCNHKGCYHAKACVD